MSDTAIKKKTFDCKQCGNPIGELYPLADGFGLLDCGGGSLATHYQGVCKICGKAVHFDVGDQKLERLIKGIQELRKSATRTPPITGGNDNP
jgi:transcription initiation factor IIE alpha subunit